MKPLFWSYHWPFNQTESLINNQDFKPKLVYVNSKNEQVGAELVDGKLVKLLG